MAVQAFAAGQFPYGVSSGLKGRSIEFDQRGVPQKCFHAQGAAEAVGDYLAGPNHTLPTCGTARFRGPGADEDGAGILDAVGNGVRVLDQ